VVPFNKDAIYHRILCVPGTSGGSILSADGKLIGISHSLLSILISRIAFTGSVSPQFRRF
jgi:hypothetical protein